MLAADMGHHECVSFLVAHGANVNNASVSIECKDFEFAFTYDIELQSSRVEVIVSIL